MRAKTKKLRQFYYLNSLAPPGMRGKTPLSRFLICRTPGAITVEAFENRGLNVTMVLVRAAKSIITTSIYELISMNISSYVASSYP